MWHELQLTIGKPVHRQSPMKDGYFAHASAPKRTMCSGLPHKRVRKIGMLNIIDVLFGQVSHGG